MLVLQWRSGFIVGFMGLWLLLWRVVARVLLVAFQWQIWRDVRGWRQEWIVWNH